MRVYTNQGMMSKLFQGLYASQLAGFHVVSDGDCSSAVSVDAQDAMSPTQFRSVTHPLARPSWKRTPSRSECNASASAVPFCSRITGRIIAPFFAGWMMLHPSCPSWQDRGWRTRFLPNNGSTRGYPRMLEPTEAEVMYWTENVV